jgi:hypothetical protein
MRNLYAAATLIILSCAGPAAFGQAQCDKDSNTGVLKKTVCESDVRSQKCKDWFAENPESAEWARDCNDPEEQGHHDEDLAVSCGGGAWDVTVDHGKAIWGMAKGLVKGAVRTPGAIISKINEKVRENTGLTCETDLACKEDLAKRAFFVCKGKDGEPQYPCTDKKQLEEISGFDLTRKLDQMVRMADTSPSYRATVLEAFRKNGVKFPEEKDGLAIIPGDLLWRMLAQKIRDTGVKLECYSWQGRMNMICYGGLGLAEDIAIGYGGVKGGQWAARALRAYKAKKAAPVATGLAQAVRAGAAREGGAAAGQGAGQGAGDGGGAASVSGAPAGGAPAGSVARDTSALRDGAGHEGALRPGAAGTDVANGGVKSADAAEAVAGAIAGTPEEEEELFLVLLRRGDAEALKSDIAKSGSLSPEKKARLLEKIDKDASLIKEVKEKFKKELAGKPDQEVLMAKIAEMRRRGVPIKDIKEAINQPVCDL